MLLAFYSLLAFGLSAFLLKLSNYVTSDGVAYLRLAENLFAGKGFSINPGEFYARHHPFYPFLIGVANFFLQDIELSGHFISILFFSLTVIPLFLLTREIYSEETAQWASFLYATHGLLLAYSNLIMTESVFTFLLMIQLYGFHRVIQKGDLRISSAILLGIAGGLGYLTRPEGLLFYGAGLIAFFFLAPNSRRIKFRFCLVSLTVFLLFFLPYVFFLSRAAGHLEIGGQGREVLVYRQLDFANPGHYMDVKKIYYGLSADKTRLKIQDLVQGHGLFYYLAADRFALIRAGIGSLTTRIFQFGNYFFGGLGFIFVGASFFSSPWDPQRKRSEFLLMTFVLPFFCYLFLLFYPRRFVPLLPLFLIWMGNGMSVWTRWLKGTFHLTKNQIRAAVLLLGLFLILPSVGYLRRVLVYGDFPFDDKRLGTWMKENIPNIQDERLASQAPFVTYYSGAQMMHLPYVEKFEDFLAYMAYHKAKYFLVNSDLEEPVRQSFLFLLDETQLPPPEISRKYVVQGKTKKLILYEIENVS